MKVAILSNFPIHVIPEFGEAYHPGGHYATWLPQLSRAFADRPGLDLHWVTLSEKISSPCRLRYNGQTFHLIQCASSGRASSLFRRDRAAIQACLDEIRPQLVHGWGNEDVYGLATVLSGYPNIVSVQGLLSHYMLKAAMHPRDYFQALVELFVLWRADLITTESEWAHRYVRRRNPVTRVEIIEYGVDDPYFDLKWQPDPRKPVALFVGSPTPRKGIHDLIAAFADPAMAHVELWIAGDSDSSWTTRLREKSTSNVRWLGRRSALEVGALMQQAWCLAIPTRADTGPTVVKEARVVGLPIISTPCGGQTTYIKNGRNGFIVEPGDIPTLLRALSATFRDFETCKAMGAWRHQEHRRVLHPGETADNFFKLYTRLLS